MTFERKGQGDDNIFLEGGSLGGCSELQALHTAHTITHCDDVEIMRDVSRINKEAVICNKGCFGLSSCPRGCIVPPRALPLRHITVAYSC